MSDAPFTPPPSTLQGFSFGSHVPPPAPDPSGKPAAAAQRAQPRRRRRGLILVALFMAIAVTAGVLLIIQGSKSVVQDAPLPALQDRQAPPNQVPVGDDGLNTVAVENADTGGGEDGWRDTRYATAVTEMSVELMEPMSVFVPSARLYSLARATESFEPSKYAGLDSIQIPDNPRRSVWHTGGGAMASVNADGSPAIEGTTFLGSHSGYAGLWGAYVNIAGLQGGETVWTKDADGRLQRWQVDRIRYMDHTLFPQEYWDSTGERRLVLTTCGGTAGADGVYNQNVFVEAKPVQDDGSPLR
ncbi:class F sortase [Arthrobacter koreensis]|uniref:class F sortase n=1 Tax=Arthrobacter koreensis TaxID=199136 RepID=UPI003812D9D4